MTQHEADVETSAGTAGDRTVGDRTAGAGTLGAGSSGDRTAGAESSAAASSGAAAGSSSTSERMRDLLARAAEEQLVEQRQVSAVLGELRGLVADLDDRLRQLEVRSGQLAEQVTDLVLARTADTLVPHVAAAVVRGVTDEVGELVRQAAAETEHRLSVHVDEAVLALAEALLRRRRGVRTAPAELGAAGSVPPPVPAPGPDPL